MWDKQLIFLLQVTEAKTLREIQVTGSRGVTGSFKETPIHEFLEKHNPSQLQFEKAVDNFTREFEQGPMSLPFCLNNISVCRLLRGLQHRHVHPRRVRPPQRQHHDQAERPPLPHRLLQVPGRRGEVWIVQERQVTTIEPF